MFAVKDTFLLLKSLTTRRKRGKGEEKDREGKRKTTKKRGANR